MSKERLEEIKTSTWNICECETCYCENFKPQMIAVEPKHFDWLIEQAERAEYYEAQNEQKIHAFEEIIDLLNEDYFENWEQAIEVAHEYKNDFVRAEKISSDLRIRETKESLKEQNKRYREALEWYSENSPHGNIADEALEESD